ncbi:Hypothetical predicted protein [Paramuricea clavata]|uniref:Uncharacterized protein n=1 Tax=Paramuricea clavata TaxID=317549 RepID=A0A6S7JYE0_PARCT|nr:Hypothetical predicted protein [Paramuricea clavata]
MNTSNPSIPISDREFASIERMKTNVLKKARERGLKIEEKIKNHFDELLKKEKRKAIGKEVKTVARQFQRRRKQTEADARKAIKDTKKWKSDITKEEKRRRKEVTDWKAEAQKWKKESQRLRRNAWPRERRAEENRRIPEGKWKGKKKFARLQLKLGDKLSKIWDRSREILKPILAKHAIKKKVKKYVINPKGAYDPSYFLTTTKDEVKTEPRNVRMSLACEMVRSDPKTWEEVSTIAHFGSKNHKLIGTDDMEEAQSIMREKILKSFSEYQRRGSGWRLRKVTQLEIHIGELQHFRGKKHEPLPKSMVKQPKELNWEGTEFPTPLNNIKKFEKNNNIYVNVFSADESLKVYYPLRVSGKTNPIILTQI